MKKLFTLLLALAMVFSLAACGSKPAGESEDAKSEDSETKSESGDTYELALITDLGTIDDKSFNQGSWEGLAQYAEEGKITHKYYQPAEQSDDAYLDAIELAVKGGAKVIVTPGYLFEVPIWKAQDIYPDVSFILVDGVPHDVDYTDFTIGENVVGINYAEEEAGFLAGYAAIKDGMTKLGFMGGMAVPAVVRFGYGFVQGAEYAAQELELGDNSVTINYHYTGGFEASPEAQAQAASWYNNGIEVIFACGGAVGNSVMAAAEQAGTKVIGVDVDQSGESDTVITSAMKGLKASVYACIEEYYNNEFPGGQVKIFEAANNGVGLPMETSKFEHFTQEDYDLIFASLVDGSITLVRDTSGEDEVKVTDIPVTRVVVNEVD